MTALAEGQIVGVIQDDVVSADEVRVAPVKTRIERTRGRRNPEWLLRELLGELIFGPEGEPGRKAARHA